MSSGKEEREKADGGKRISDRFSEMREAAMKTGRRARELLTGKEGERMEEDAESVKGTAARRRRNIMGSFASWTEAVRSKLTQRQPTEIVRERGGRGRRKDGDVEEDDTSDAPPRTSGRD